MAKASITSETWRVPAVPGAGLIVVEPEFVLRGLEAVLDRPAMPFDLDQGFDTRSGGAPGGEEGQILVGDIAADQEPPGPQAGSVAVVFGSVEIGQLAIAQSCSRAPWCRPRR